MKASGKPAGKPGRVGSIPSIHVPEQRLVGKSRKIKGYCVCRTDQFGFYPLAFGNIWRRSEMRFESEEGCIFNRETYERNRSLHIFLERIAHDISSY